MKVYAASRCIVAEGPRWNDAERALYWVDVTGGKYYRHFDGVPADRFEEASPDIGFIGALAFSERGVLLFASDCKVWECAFGERPVLKYELPGYAGRRFNDVWADGGNFFCGIARDPSHPGEFWRLSSDGSFSCIERQTAGMPNGMGVSPDGKTFYFTVTDERRIYAYDYDRATGMLSNRRIFAEDFLGEGMPDGICVDQSDGSVFVAMWDGSRLEHRAADGRLIGTLRFPMKKVTSAEVVGERVFVTTGNKDADPEAYHASTGAGSVFEITRGECNGN